MNEKKTSLMEYALFFLCAFGGIGIMLALGIALLPKGPLLFALYGLVGAVAGGVVGQMLWRLFRPKDSP